MTGVLEENSRFRQLIQYIEQGWKIDEPVLLGTMWRLAIMRMVVPTILYSGMSSKTKPQC